jgi:hypothetical protein
MKNFVSVSTNAARFQDISLNPQKLAGMCAKLKCCLNYEVDEYVEAGRQLPSREMVLQTLDADYYLFKSDILAGLVTYSTDRNIAANLETITAERAKQVIEMNRRGEKPETLTEGGKTPPKKVAVDLTGGDISRFDRTKKKRKKKNVQPAEGTANAEQGPREARQRESKPDSKMNQKRENRPREKKFQQGKNESKQ